MTVHTTIEIDLECSDEDVLVDILAALNGILPYMADNVAVRNWNSSEPSDQT